MGRIVSAEEYKRMRTTWREEKVTTQWKRDCRTDWEMRISRETQVSIMGPSQAYPDQYRTWGSVQSNLQDAKIRALQEARRRAVKRLAILTEDIQILDELLQSAGDEPKGIDLNRIPVSKEASRWQQ